MREHQRNELTKRVALILDEPGPYAPHLDAARVLYGATHAELVEIVGNLDHMVAREYVDAYEETE